MPSRAHHVVGAARDAPVRWRRLAMLVPVVVIVRRRRRLELPRPVSQALVVTAPVLVYFSAPRSRVRDAAVWLARMWAYKISFEIPYDKPERLRARLHVQEIAKLDARLGGGEPPTARLQRRLHAGRLLALPRGAAVVGI
jgi:hypothetical protein